MSNINAVVVERWNALWVIFFSARFYPKDVDEVARTGGVTPVIAGGNVGGVHGDIFMWEKCHTQRKV